VSRVAFARAGPLLVFALALLAVLPAWGQTRAKADPVTHVYFIRGFLNVFSTGLDEMSAQLANAGVKSIVHGHMSGSSVRAQLLADRKKAGKPPNPVVVVGHSFGANAALSVSSLLAADGIPVDLVITIDPTVGGPLTPNVRRYVNYHFAGNNLGVPLTSPKLGKRISNIDLSRRKDVAGVGDDHWTVTSNKALQKEILAAIRREVGRRR
jgi:hypothetical protein